LANIFGAGRLLNFKAI